MSRREGWRSLPAESALLAPAIASGLLEPASVSEQPANAKAKLNPTKARVPIMRTVYGRPPSVASIKSAALDP